jgi:peroxiredoxin
MEKMAVLTAAQEFELKDTRGNLVRLSDYRGLQPVVLVLTRGFI